MQFSQYAASHTAEVQTTLRACRRRQKRVAKFPSLRSLTSTLYRMHLKKNFARTRSKVLWMERAKKSMFPSLRERSICLEIVQCSPLLQFISWLANIFSPLFPPKIRSRDGRLRSLKLPRERGRTSQIFNNWKTTIKSRLQWESATLKDPRISLLSAQAQNQKMRRVSRKGMIGMDYRAHYATTNFIHHVETSCSLELRCSRTSMMGETL